MDSPSLSNQFDIFHIYRRYCEITYEAYASEGNGYRHSNESMKAKLAREALCQLLELVESRVYKRMTIFEELFVLMSRLNLAVDSHEFSRFYNFVFFMCRENGQRSITVSRAVIAWKLVLSGRFRLLNRWCSFIENNQRHNISEDTWRQVLAFSRCVHENLEGYDPQGAWPVLIDEFVEHMYRMSGSEDAHKLGCSGASEAQPIYEALPGLKVYPGAKRKLDGQELECMDTFVDSNAIFISKRRHTVDHVKYNNPFGCCKSPCAVEGGLSKGCAQLFSSHSSVQFDHESRMSYIENLMFM